MKLVVPSMIIKKIGEILKEAPQLINSKINAA